MRSPPIHRITIGELEQQFKRFDCDGDGAITEGIVFLKISSYHSKGIFFS